MITVYIPRKKFSINQNNNIIDAKGIVMYQHKSSFFQGRLSLFKENRLLYTSNQLLSFRKRYEIRRNGSPICVVTEKGFFTMNYTIESKIGNYSIVGKPWREEFQIVDEDRLVLSVSKDVNKVYKKIILVDEENSEFLLILMFSLIVLAQLGSST